MNYPKHSVYDALYARYIERRPAEELVDVAGDLKGKNVLDLCGGAGRITREAKRRGAAFAALVEQCNDMIDFRSFESVDMETTEIFSIPLKNYVSSYPPYFEVNGALRVLEVRTSKKYDFDVAFCRQAVNYWLDGSSARQLSKIIVKDGLFIFNTFNRKPSEKPVVKEYDYNGYHFVEVSQLVDEMVNHVQIREGMEPHMTRFKWISPEQYTEWLEPHFEIEAQVDGATTIYKCRRK